MVILLAAMAAFIGTHFAMSHPLRAPMVAALGAVKFQLVYSLISLLSFGWVIYAFWCAPPGAPLWIAGDAIWALASAIMLGGSILFAGSIIGNPALPQPGAQAMAQAAARGVFAITRHPMMWGFTAWSVTHLLVSPQPRVLILTIGIAILALGGSLGQDRKKAVLMGGAWAGWVARTRFIPFAGQISGAIAWRAAWPGRTIILIGSALWLLASWAHPYLGAPVVGIWRWLLFRE